MGATFTGPLALRVDIERWSRVTPVRITGYSWNVVQVLVVSLESNSRVGRGEAAGVYYRNEDPASMRTQIEAMRPEIERGITREALQQMLPCGGARNALDCALWDLESKVTSEPVWKLAGLERPVSLRTTFTCHAEEPGEMAARARSYKGARAVKLKLTGEPVDAERVRAVRRSLPNVWLSVDANQGFSPSLLEQLMPVLIEAQVALIEQPFPIGHEHLLDRVESPIPIAADESVQGISDIPSLLGRFNVVNIKLDKCGGLTEGLEMVRAARALGLNVMVGSMGGTSLAMAPAFLVGQLCSVVDLDGPIFLKSDRTDAATYDDGLICCPQSVWG